MRFYGFLSVLFLLCAALGCSTTMVGTPPQYYGDGSQVVQDTDTVYYDDSGNQYTVASQSPAYAPAPGYAPAPAYAPGYAPAPAYAPGYDPGPATASQGQHYSMLSPSEFDSLLASVNKESFDDSKLQLIRESARYGAFSSDQVARLVQALSFANNQVEAAVLLYKRTVDARN